MIYCFYSILGSFLDLYKIVYSEKTINIDSEYKVRLNKLKITFKYHLLHFCQLESQCQNAYKLIFYCSV